MDYSEIQKLATAAKSEVEGWGDITPNACLSEVDVRMACVALFVNELNLTPSSACSYLREIDKLSNFILSGLIAKPSTGGGNGGKVED